MIHRVILQFSNFEARELWLREMRDHTLRVYKRNPWLAAELSDEQLARLTQQAENVKIFPDAQMTPFLA
jgi:hypothetical protein